MEANSLSHDKDVV